MAGKGGKTEGAGRKVGSKQDREKMLFRNLCGGEIVPENRDRIIRRLGDIFEKGTNQEVLDALRVINSAEGKVVELTGKDGKDLPFSVVVIGGSQDRRSGE